VEFFDSLKRQAESVKQKVADAAAAHVDVDDLKAKAQGVAKVVNDGVTKAQDGLCAGLGIERQQVEDAADKVQQRLDTVRDRVLEGTDKAAIAVAQKVTELRGVETTPEQVKKVAKIVGITVLVVGAAGLIADAMADGGDWGTGEGEGAGGDVAAGGGAEASAAPSSGGTGDAVGDAKMMLAEAGSPMNTVTHVVDGDGVILDHGG
jgi:D-Tyr-tRNAtyr deacylase